MCCSNKAAIKKQQMKTRKEDIRTTRKKAKAMGLQNIQFSTWGYHWERFIHLTPTFYQEFLDGDDKKRCDWAKKYCLLITDGYAESEIFALKIDGIQLLPFANNVWIDGSKRISKSEEVA